MLLKTNIKSPFEKKQHLRLVILEDYLRQRSWGEITLFEYQSLLSKYKSEIGDLPSERTLSTDLHSYAFYCDDIKHGHKDKTKIMSIKEDARHDAICWLMGHPWADSPLRPNLRSSVVRCLLLAIHKKHVVTFLYKPLRKPNEPWSIKTVTGLPTSCTPGQDSGYVQIMFKDGQCYSYNIARIQGGVEFSDLNNLEEKDISKEMTRITIRMKDRERFETLLTQFNGIKETTDLDGKMVGVIEVQNGIKNMVTDVIVGHIYRITKRFELVKNTIEDTNSGLIITFEDKK